MYVKRRIYCEIMNFQALRKNLLEQVEEVFPDETEAYRDIRSQSSVVSTVPYLLRSQPSH